MFTKSTAAILFLCLSSATAVLADDQTKASSLDSKDKKFLMNAAMGAMTEIEIGKVAVANGSADSVKQFGQMLVTDHGKELDELKTLAQSKAVDLPMELDKSHKKMTDKMGKMTGADFDKAFAKDMVSDHTKDLKEFQKEADKAADPDVKAFAAKQVPTLQEHLDKAKQLPK